MAVAQRLRWLVIDLAPRSRHSRLMMCGAFVWAVSAAVHVVVFLVDGGAWAGAVSWRKPIVFSISIAAILWSFGWVIDRLPAAPRLAAALAWTFLVSSSVEVGLIVLQTWRGRPSHFNDATPLDSGIFAAMGIMVGVMSLALVALFAWALVRSPTDPATRLAVTAGLATIVVGLGIGQWIIDLGVAHLERVGSVPDTVVSGDAGVAKFPHAVALHGIQVYAFMVAATRRHPSGHRIVLAAVAGYSSLLAFAIAQSVGGRAPFDVDAVAASLLAIGLALVLSSLVTAVRGWWDATDLTPAARTTLRS